ncbi:MAG: AzlD domain-containing protein [Clostridia bacterium]|nr:AzlD domain-containing protein [Clostridia bacterium]
MNNTVYLVLAVLVCAVCTFALRLAPFALFSGKRGMPPAVRKLAKKMPAAIIAVLVIYCLKGMPAAGLSENAATLVSVAAVVALHLWKKNTLLSIAGGTALYMALLHII